LWQIKNKLKKGLTHSQDLSECVRSIEQQPKTNMTIAQLINHLNAIEDKNKEIKFSDISTNYKYKVFCIDKKDNEIIIEDTGE
jgi:hypothetical protein